MPEQALRRHHDERLAEVAPHLPAQHVEHLRRRRRHAHDHVVLGAELQETLEARRRVLRALPLESVRQEHRESAVAAPLRFARADELVDDDLRAVHEVAELPFPDHEAVRVRRRVAVLEAEHRLLRQQRIRDTKPRLAGLQVLERNVARTGLLVVADGVAVEERAATAVLARDADLVAFVEQRGIRERLGEAPVEHHLAGRHPAAVVDDLLHLPVQHEAVGIRRRADAEIPQHLALHAGADLLGPVHVVVLRPVHGVDVADQYRGCSSPAACRHRRRGRCGTPRPSLSASPATIAPSPASLSA